MSSYPSQSSDGPRTRSRAAATAGGDRSASSSSSIGAAARSRDDDRGDGDDARDRRDDARGGGGGGGGGVAITAPPPPHPARGRDDDARTTTTTTAAAAGDDAASVRGGADGVRWEYGAIATLRDSFGFVRRHHKPGPQLFFHASEVSEGIATLKPGDDVRFVLREAVPGAGARDRESKPNATRVEKVNADEMRPVVKRAAVVGEVVRALRGKTKLESYGGRISFQIGSGDAPAAGLDDDAFPALGGGGEKRPAAAAAAAAVRLLPIRPRSRGARRSLRTFPVVTLHPRFPFNV